MCGIAGIVGGSAERHREPLERMLAAIAHRGPDGEGLHAVPGCLLGHRRLAIVDIEAGGQPMLDPDTGTAITCNGEIYGFQSLRKEFSGFPYRTRSDTEVILAMYRELGPAMLSRLPGMFAFALWDPRSRSLFCARDRFGEKPFYFTITRDGLFLFASEIKALAASGLVEGKISQRAVAHYLQRLYVRPHESVFEGINVLPPGHTLQFAEGQVTIARYWAPPEPSRRRMSVSEAAEELRYLLKRSVARQFVADVPVGAFLSGGLDSSTIVACAADRGTTVQSFSVDLAGGLSEMRFARDVAKRFSTEHTELSCSDYDVATELVRMGRIFDEPFGDSSAIPTYLIAREARKHVKVVLTGDGGDELCGGYTWYRSLAWMQEAQRGSFLALKLARLAMGLRSRLGLLRDMDEEFQAEGTRLATKYDSVLAAHDVQMQFASAADLALLGLPGAERRPPWTDMPQGMPDGVDSALRADFVDYLPGDILVKIDRASMANGLELRAPFLDVDVAEFMLALPSSLKVSPKKDKILLRAAFKRDWPASVRNRSKQGFGAPVAHWLAMPRVRDLDHELLRTRSSPLFDILAFDGTQAVLEKAPVYVYWAMLALAVWARESRQIWSSGGR